MSDFDRLADRFEVVDGVLAAVADLEGAAAVRADAVVAEQVDGDRGGLWWWHRGASPVEPSGFGVVHMSGRVWG
jgi:hypothetical protein